jgi:hypothetical protein
MADCKLLPQKRSKRARGLKTDFSAFSVHEKLMLKKLHACECINSAENWRENLRYRLRQTAR